MRERVEEIFNFFKKEEILSDSLNLTFSDYEQSNFNSHFHYINLSYNKVENVPGLDRITCKNDENLLNAFETDEITLFHEIGHACDFQYRVKEEKAWLKQREKDCKVIDKLARTLRQYQYSNVFNVILIEANRVYRETVLEKAADENAYNLMKYYLENKKELTEK